MSRTARAILLSLLVLVAPATAHAASYARTATLEVDGSRVTVDIYGLQRAARSASRSWRMAGRARARDTAMRGARWPSRVIRSFPTCPTTRPMGQRTTIVALVGQLETGALGAAAGRALVAGVVGTSAGGLATIWRRRSCRASGWVGLDPAAAHGHGHVCRIEARRTGDRAARRRVGVQPVVERQDARELGAAPVRSVKIDGASHCDFEAPTNGFCSVMCGFGSRAKQLEAQNATVLAALVLAMAHAAQAPVMLPPPPARRHPGRPRSHCRRTLIRRRSVDRGECAPVAV
jgi:hypothetical protein